MKDKDSRESTRTITVHVPEHTFRRLRMISAALDKTNAEIITEAIDKIDVQVIEVVIEQRPPAKKPAARNGTDWLDYLRPGPGEESITEPWKPTSKDRQVEPDLSTASKAKRGGR